MKPLHLFSIFVLVAIAQLFIPSQMILGQKKILSDGTPYKFITQPIDPSDPFKGKYIRLDFEISSLATNDSTWNRQEDVFVVIENDDYGFARVKEVTRQKPEGKDFVEAKVSWYNAYDKELNLSFPFDEFYMNENKAYDAEVAHRDAQRDSIKNNTYALVFIKDGEAVLDNVFINEIPIADFVE